MAIDTARKRFSKMSRGMPWVRPLPLPSGGFDRAGRLHLLAVYTIPISIFWTGVVSENWSFANNWNPASVPDEYTKCNFSSGTFRPCTLTADAACYSLTLGSLWNRFLTLGSFDMTVQNDVDILGGGVDRGDGTFIIGGDVAHQGGRIDFNDVGPATTAVGGDLTVASGGLWYVTQLAGHTITVGGNLSLDSLTLTASGTWTLTVEGSAVATGVTVAYSDASGGAQIVANDGTNTDSGNNANWLFVVVADQTITFPTVIRRPSAGPAVPLRKTSGSATPMRRVSELNTTLRRPH